MIALVEFKNSLVIDRNEAEKLKLNYEDKERFGKSCSYGKEIRPMDDNDYYTDELFQDGEKFYTDDTMAKEVNDYRRCERIADKDWVYVPQSNNLVDLEHFALNCRFPYTITKCIKSEEPTASNLTSMLNQIEEKFEYINKELDIFKNQQFNQKVNVHVGGGLIVTYNELMLKENSCTDMIQECLNEGWRIIAVCVQPDNRRPDYILGRYNPKFDSDTSAKR
jgi:hypothetical protein